MSELKPTDAEMAAEMHRLSIALETLNNHRVVRLHNKPWRMVWFQFLRGLAFGFGTFIGASAFVSVVLLALSQVEFIPIVGSWATQIINEIEQATR